MSGKLHTNDTSLEREKRSTTFFGEPGTRGAKQNEGSFWTYHHVPEVVPDRGRRGRSHWPRQAAHGHQHQRQQCEEPQTMPPHLFFSPPLKAREERKKRAKAMKTARFSRSFPPRVPATSARGSSACLPQQRTPSTQLDTLLILRTVLGITKITSLKEKIFPSM